MPQGGAPRLVSTICDRLSYDIVFTEKAVSMRAFEVTGPGETVLKLDFPKPEPARGEALIEIEACGLNFADLLMIEGSYQDTPTVPFVPGLEVCGKVVALGEDTEGPAPGTRIAVFGGQGGLAEFGCFPAARLVPVPEAMPAPIAAGFLVAWSTSHVALANRARLQRGERLLVLGAAGGVGLTAVELGAHMGAEVVAVARGEAKLAVAKEHGARHLIDAEDPEILDKLKAIGGVDVVYDAVGGAAAKAAFRAIRPGGRYLVVGFASGEVPNFAANHLLVKNVDLIGLYWGGMAGYAPDVITDSIATLLDLYARGKIAPHVSHVLPLERCEDALELIRSRRSTGKVVVTP